MIVSLVMFAQAAALCGSRVNVDTLAAVARAESRFDSAAINDNTARRRYSGLSDADATATATRLLAAGHSLDLGLMQVNSANLHSLGLSVAGAFDTCKSIAAGARILVEGYHAPGAGVDVHNWSRDIQARQDSIRRSYLGHAGELATGDNNDRQLARDIQRFVENMPVPLTRRQAIAIELRHVLERRTNRAAPVAQDIEPSRAERIISPIISPSLVPKGR